ncbi:MAG: GGDEF domain-containing protein [Thermoleophilia bacterium]
MEHVETYMKFASLVFALVALYFAARILPSIGKDIRKRSWLFLSLAAISFGLSMAISVLSDVANPALHDIYELMEFLFVIFLAIGFYYLYTTEHKETIKLKHLSTTDDLTNLFSHGFFQTYLVNKVSNLRSSTGDLTVLFADIDDFKMYNDKFGHQEGDYVLKKVADVITREARGEDLASRYGGEEFTLILGCDFEMASAVAERLRMSIAERCSMMSDDRMKRDVTVSIGIASYGHDSNEADKLVKIADSRMYMAKSRGKNQVYTGDLLPEVMKGDSPAVREIPSLDGDTGLEAAG